MTDRPPPWGIAILLLAANTLSFVDRSVMTLLVAPIRAELGVSDTQISLLHGFAFAGCYALIGMPLGLLADRVDRPRLAAAGVAVWSLMSAACGLMTSFGALFAMRMGVAVGEATLSPTAVSLLSDRFPRSLLARALAVFQSGIFLGSALALLGGGWLLGAIGPSGLVVPVLGTLSSWRVVFIALGVPGLAVAASLLFVGEARRGRVAALRPTLRATLRFVRSQRSLFAPLIAAFTLITILAYGTLAWTPSVLVRLHHVATSDAGLWLGAILLVMGPLGVLASGWLVDRLRSRGRDDAPIVAATISLALFAVAVPLFALAPNLWTALAAAALLAFSQSTPYGIALASLALATPAHMRGQVTALYLLISNLVGLSLGPLIVALLTDRVFDDDLAVGKSLAVLAVLTAPPAFAALARCRRSYVVSAG